MDVMYVDLLTVMKNKALLDTNRTQTSFSRGKVLWMTYLNTPTTPWLALYTAAGEGTFHEWRYRDNYSVQLETLTTDQAAVFKALGVRAGCNFKDIASHLTSVLCISVTCKAKILQWNRWWVGKKLLEHLYLAVYIIQFVYYMPESTLKKNEIFSQISCMVVESAVCAPVQPHPHIFTAFPSSSPRSPVCWAGYVFRGRYG